MFLRIKHTYIISKNMFPIKSIYLLYKVDMLLNIDTSLSIIIELMKIKIISNIFVIIND